jgi:hypothetical protein
VKTQENKVGSKLDSQYNRVGWMIIIIHPSWPVRGCYEMDE